jgi:hypothetical protein
MRRVVLGTNMSMQLQFDPVNPHVQPVCRFFGPEHAVGPLRTAILKLAKFLHAGLFFIIPQTLFRGNVGWDKAESPRRNLETILGTSFPARESDGISLVIECGICYSYKLNDQTPDCVCDEVRCSKAYHATCIQVFLLAPFTCWLFIVCGFQECLRAAPETRQLFSTLIGLRRVFFFSRST